MTERKEHRAIPTEHRAQEHLANERTFLAWIRTAIALISLGFVLARAAPLMAGGSKASRLTEKLLPVGVGLVILGALAGVLAAWHYDVVNRQIETGLVKTDRALVWFVAIVIIILSSALVIYMLMTPAEGS